MGNPSYNKNNHRAREGVLTRPMGLSKNRGCGGKAGGF